MKNSQFALLKDRRFAPLFVTLFLGAFHDNLFKNAFVVLLLYSVSMHSEYDPKLLTTAAAGLFILPYALFSAMAGDMTDKYAKHRMIRIIKACEVGIAGLGALALVTGSLPLSFLTLFALGMHSTFFAPGKFALLPQHLKKEELIAGNALLNTGTFLAILAGTIAGAMLVMQRNGPVLVGVALFACAIIGYIASRFIPDSPSLYPVRRISINLPVETAKLLHYTFTRPRNVVLSILGISWFYFMGGMFMAQFPNYTHETLGASEEVLTFFLIIFSVGIAIGGLLNHRLLKGRVEAVYVPLAALGITIFSIDLYFANGGVHRSTELLGLQAFLQYPAHWRIALDIFMIALSGGFFVVPLNAIVQNLTPENERARVLAGSATSDALFIVASAALSAGLISAGWSIRDLFLGFAIANGFVALYICKLLPDYLIKSLLQGLFKLVYHVEVKGLENFEKVGNRAVIVANHVSLLDPPLLAAFLPGRPMFAVHPKVTTWWWAKPFLKFIDFFPVDPANPFSLKALIRKVQEDRHVVIFPEGRLTETGALMKIYDGPGLIADKAKAMILPVRVDGVQHTGFARLKGKVRARRFPKVTLTILEPRHFNIDENIKGRARRAAAGKELYNLMEDMMFQTGKPDQTLFEALLRARSMHGGNIVIAEDVERNPMKLEKFIRGSLILGQKFSCFSGKGENVGLMLPNSLGAAISLFGLQAYGRVPAMLNYSTGGKALLSACRTAQVKTVITSRRFVEFGKLDTLIEALQQQVKIVWLEDIKKSIGWSDILFGMFASAGRLHDRQDISPESPALVLFTSGSEGEPKGVVLSHINIMSNITQLSARVDFNREDIVFTCLPMFHSFGLTGGILLPILSGVRTFLYPSPLHYRIVPEMVYSANATIMFGTDTFLQGYARMASPYDFYRMRYIFAGAEKVKEETRRVYMEKFGVQILEGYGATETAPAIAVNSAMHNRNGTVGRFLPGIEYRLENVPGVHEGGRLFVRGPNVMLGYYKSDKPGTLQKPDSDWYDTGDIVAVDADGYVRIIGRMKRFAKIAGEMVSLAVPENIALALWPQAQHAVIALPDPRKGEQLVLITTEEKATREALSSYAAKNNIPGLAVPADILYVVKMPVLGSGKTDYPAVKTLAEKKHVKAA